MYPVFSIEERRHVRTDCRPVTYLQFCNIIMKCQPIQPVFFMTDLSIVLQHSSTTISRPLVPPEENSILSRRARVLITLSHRPDGIIPAVTQPCGFAFLLTVQAVPRREQMSDICRFPFRPMDVGLQDLAAATLWYLRYRHLYHISYRLTSILHTTTGH
jgi:hypothetical protein